MERFHRSPGPAAGLSRSVDGGDRTVGVGSLEQHGVVAFTRPHRHPTLRIIGMRASAEGLLIGLDAMDVTLVRRWAEEGDLPNLARVMATGTRGRFENEAGTFVGSVWPTLYTGRSVGEHLRIAGTQFCPETYGYRPHELDGPTVWDRCARAGLPIVIIDVPHGRATPGVDGTQIFEWGCHDRRYGTHALPEGVLTDIAERYGAHPVGTAHAYDDPRHSPCDHVHRSGDRRTPAEELALWRDLLEGLRRKHEMTLDLLRRTPRGFFMCVFGESHCVGHQFWHLHDPTHPDYDPAVLRLLGVDDPIREIYRRLDRAVGDLIDAAGHDWHRWVLLSHGMQAHYDPTHLLPALLHRLDRRWGGEEHYAGPRVQRIERALAVVPRPLARCLVRLLGQVATRRSFGDRDAAFESLPPLHQRRLMPIDNNTVAGAVRLNISGREAHGLVAADDRDRMLDWLERRLSEIVDLDSGQPIVSGVVRTDRSYPDDESQALPDLFVQWRRDHPIRRIWSPSIGLIEAAYDGPRTGDHVPHGLLITVADHLAPGEVTISPLDVAPTIGASLGLDVTDLPGRPIRSMLAPELRAAG
jgi:predicted AlkP superfamily phosphohydrolase/phosphomutase